ncbi:hypothetical protein CC1G_12156 [Coprinopsis cinerea okayama7|uniref:LYC1 C-terminal domain-containing protein n=1 Tax=Coprinopsis cinerea (strain Okayama-7 / 130 / ATCC MYA-4618 / FGSC 9003) TaxID=240176 RepID=A8N0B8_COPC7|nr:hypothetical protein CC1G_12156 [Coprinopsis cinerea okayama7\|eukprot:XP_001828315.1 hypothetical protein CC1G_12156 [Coprinopsis cinerea okayama7\
MPTDLSRYSLFMAKPAQAEEAQKRSFEQWGKYMTLEEYLGRDARVQRSTVGKDGQFVAWVLAPRDDPTTLDFMCACKTFRREVVITKGTGSNSSTETGVGYGIASVYTPPEKRKKGYRKHMMQLLHWVLLRPEALPKFPQEWGAPPTRHEGLGDGSVSVLYSVVGTRFYQSCGLLQESDDGWVTAENRASTVWKVDPLAKWAKDRPAQEAIKWEWLDRDCILAVWEKDSSAIREEMTQVQLRDGVQAGFSFIPGSGLGEFQHLHVHSFIEKQDPKPQFFGVAIGEEQGASSHAYASWTFSYYPRAGKMIITRLHAPATLISELLAQIAEYSKALCMETLEVWNLPEELLPVAHEAGGVTTTLDRHIPCMKWYGPENVEWVNNQK